MRQVIEIIRKNHPVLFAFMIYLVGLTLWSAIGTAVDDRTLVGINVWIKPLKFAVSTLIYVATIGYMLHFFPYSRRKKRILVGIVSWTLFIEMIIVPLQAFRGVKSHFNMETPLDGIMFAAMGILIGINVLLMVLFLIDSMRLKLNVAPSVKWGIVLGWAVVIFGSWVGGQMLSEVGHNIGVADGGDGLPLLNWSTIAGDLRVAHFFGLHGIQAIPLFAILFLKKWNTKERNRVLAVFGFGLAYAGWIAYTFYQAKQAMPFLAIG